MAVSIVNGVPDSDQDNPKAAHAVAAIHERIAQATVFILPGGAREAPENVWSGTIIRTPGDRLVVLASKHMFERDELGDEPCRVCWYRCADTLEPFAPIRVEHPGDVDVAAFLVRPDREGPMRAHAIAYSAVVPWITDAEPDDTVFLSGYPANLIAVTRDHAAPRGTLGFTNIAYGVNVRYLVRDDRDRVALEWREMVVRPDPTIRELPPPNGMSGGALWYLEPREKPAGAIWQPGSASGLSACRAHGTRTRASQKSRAPIAGSIGSEMRSRSSIWRHGEGGSREPDPARRPPLAERGAILRPGWRGARSGAGPTGAAAEPGGAHVACRARVSAGVLARLEVGE